MSHTLNCLSVHAVFGTANRRPWITSAIHGRLHGYLRSVLNDLHCTFAASNGMADHVHILFLLDSRQSVSSVMSKLKANSSRWVKGISPENRNFSWQSGYAAFAVSPSNKQRVIDYINNQEKHHQEVTFEEEYAKLLRLGKMAVEE